MNMIIAASALTMQRTTYAMQACYCSIGSTTASHNKFRL